MCKEGGEHFVDVALWEETIANNEDACEENSDEEILLNKTDAENILWGPPIIDFNLSEISPNCMESSTSSKLIKMNIPLHS